MFASFPNAVPYMVCVWLANYPYGSRRAGKGSRSPCVLPRDCMGWLSQRLAGAGLPEILPDVVAARVGRRLHIVGLLELEQGSVHSPLACWGREAQCLQQYFRRPADSYSVPCVYT